MATTIKLKNGSGAPLAGDLVAGEPALDLTNKRLYTENAGGTVIEIGTSPSTIDINAGTIDGTVIGGSSAAAGTFTTFTSTGIDDNATSTAITIDSSENVNIGAVGTTTLTTLTGPFNGDVVKMDGSSGVSDRHLIFSNSSNSQKWNIDAEGGASSLGVLSFSTNSTERMTIDNSGNVGIGTSSPVSLGAGYKNLDIRHTTGGGVTLGDASNIHAYLFSDNNGVTLQSPGSRSIKFTTVSTERMRIDASGNVGIGNNSPTYALDITDSTECWVRVNSDATTDCGLRFAHGGTNHFVIGHEGDTDGLQFFDNIAGSERMRIDASGNLLVGTTTAAGKLTLDNASNTLVTLLVSIDSGGTGAHTHAEWRNTNGTVGSIVTTGTTTAYNTSSDQRLKENIVDAPAGNIDAIRVRSFDWKADGSHQTYGMVAQELVDVAPEAVSQGETEDDMWGVDYSKLVPMMIKEIQDLKAKVAELESR